MAILGPLAFRANKWNKGLTISSPLMEQFVWEQPLVWASCNILDHSTNGITEYGCHYDDDGHLSPGKDHGCGIYATLDRQTLMYYFGDDSCVVYLVEAWGEYQLGDRGWRGGGAQVVHIVNTTPFKKISKIKHDGEHFERKLDAQGISMLAASHKFGVSLIDWDVAMEMCKVMWAKLDMDWPLRGGF